MLIATRTLTFKLDTYKHDVAAVQPVGLDSGDEELGACWGEQVPRTVTFNTCRHRPLCLSTLFATLRPGQMARRA